MQNDIVTIVEPPWSEHEASAAGLDGRAASGEGDSDPAACRSIFSRWIRAWQRSFITRRTRHKPITYQLVDPRMVHDWLGVDG